MISYLYDIGRKITPHAVRRWLKSRTWFVPLFRTIFGNRVYSEGYFEDIERIEKKSVPHIADWICRRIDPQSIIDVGCGPGHMVESLEIRGVDTFGIDISDAALRRTRKKGLEVERFDLRSEAPLPGGEYDLAVCCEVAEHIEEKYAASLVQKLTDVAPIVYMTAAEPDGPPGLFHVNEQEHDYWIRLMEAQGYHYEEDLTMDARRVLNKRSVVSHLARPLIFSANKNALPDKR